MMGFYEDFDRYILSPNHGGPSGIIVAECVHDAEYPERGTAAEDIGNFFSRPSVAASTTGCIDNNSKVGCVPYGTKAWHSGAGDPWNGAIEGYEHSGYASQSAEDWIDVYGLQMLEISSKHYAKRCQDLGIPPRKINEHQLREAVLSRNPNRGGICGHIEITKAAGVYGGHWDPGPNFPWSYYIDRVVHFYNGGKPDEEIVNTPPQPIIRRATMGYAHKFADKPTVWITEMRPTGPDLGAGQKAMELWYVPMSDPNDIPAMIRNGDIVGVRTLGAGQDKNGSPDNDAAFDHCKARGRVIGL